MELYNTVSSKMPHCHTLPSHSIVIYPLTLGSSPENCPHCKQDTLTEKIYARSTKKTTVEFVIARYFLEEEVCVIKLFFLDLLPAESKQITCQSCPM